MPDENEERLEITEDFLAEMGDYSLKGLIFKQFGRLPKKLVLVFFETSLSWRSEHYGPQLRIAPEYMPRCLVEQVLALNEECDLRVIHEVKDPEK